MHRRHESLAVKLAGVLREMKRTGIHKRLVDSVAE